MRPRGSEAGARSYCQVSVLADMKRRTVHDLLTEARSSLRRIDPFRAHAAMQEGALLIDIRSNDERAEHGSIPGSLHIPLSVLEWRVDRAGES